MQALISPESARASGRRVRFPSWAVVNLLALGCSACGGNNDASREVPANDAAAASPAVAVCDLLSRDEVATILGEAVDEPRSQVIGMPGPDRAGIAECSYRVLSDSRKFVSLFLRQSPAPDNDPGGMREMLATSGATVVDEMGVGDASFWDGNALHVFSGRHIYFTITIAGLNPTAMARDHARTFALRVLERLPPPPAP